MPSRRDGMAGGGTRGQALKDRSHEALQADVLGELLARCRAHAGAVSRRELVRAMRAIGHLRDLSEDVADRQIRAAINKLRRTHPLGALIASSSSGAGYRIALTAEELEAVLAEDERRAHSILQRTSIQRRKGLDALRALPYQQGRLL